MGAVCSKRGCDNQAISDRTKYCRDCQANRIRSWKLAKGLTEDMRWRDYATTVNQKVIHKYANRWVVPEKVEL